MTRAAGEVAARHGVSRARVYQLVDSARREAQEEMHFWRRVLELLGR